MAKFSYDVNIPGSGSFEVNSDTELTDQQAYQYALQSMPSRGVGEEFIRGTGLAARGAAPVVAGAMLGAPLGPVGSLAGMLALPTAELATQAANVVLPQQYQIPSPAGAVENLLTKIGFPVPETTGERAIQIGGSALTGTAGQLATLPTLAKTATTELGRNIAGQMAQQPSRQLAASAPAAMASQVVAEETGSPVAGMAAGMLTSAPFGIGVKPTQVEQVPSIPQLKQLSSKLYKISEDAGVVYKPEAFGNLVGGLDLEANARTGAFKGYSKREHTGITNIIADMKDELSKPQTLESLDSIRQSVLSVAMKPSATGQEKMIAGNIIDRIDKFIENTSGRMLVKDDTKAIETLKEARVLWKQAKKAEILDDVFESADVRQARYSQSGFENALRGKLITLADNPALLKSFSKTEQDAIKAAAKGGNVQNFLRWAGKLTPSSVVAGAGGSYLGASLFGPAGAVIAPVVGYGSRLGAERMQTNQFRRLEDMLKLGRQPKTPISNIPPILSRGIISSNSPLNVTQEELQQIYGQ
jgi:hypothetical protein